MKVVPPRRRDPLTVWLVLVALLIAAMLLAAALATPVVPIPGV